MNQDPENQMIGSFLAAVAPLIVRLVRERLELLGLRVRQEGRGLDFAFYIGTAQGEVQFLLHNLLLELATVDRDENPLRFDERLLDLDYFAWKTTRLTESKFQVLSCLLGKGSLDEAVRDIEALAKDYGRVRIWWIGARADSASR